MINRDNVQADRHKGFSLVELVVVLVLMSLLAALVSLSLRGVVARQRLGLATEVLEHFDAALRRHARHRRRDTIGLIEPARRRMVIQASDAPRREFKLPRSVSISSIRRESARSATRSVKIPSVGDGATPSYAVRLQSGGSQRWVFFSGISGQVVHGLDDSSVASLLRVR